MSHAAIIEAKGTDRIAAATGQPRDHVRVWKHRGIPRSRFADILAAFPDVTLDMLKAGAPQ
jgi:hypothetical protein